MNYIESGDEAYRDLFSGAKLKMLAGKQNNELTTKEIYIRERRCNPRDHAHKIFSQTF